MFSPSITEGVQTRSRRRRQRPKSTDDLAPPPKAKRQRLPLTEQTFVNPEVAPEMFEVKSDRIPRIDFKRDEIENLAVPKKEPSARAKKVKAAERAGKGDGSVILVCLDHRESLIIFCHR
jgi:nuclear pore complex protein Nup133